MSTEVVERGRTVADGSNMQILHIAFPQKFTFFKHIILVIENYCELYFSFLSELKVTLYKVVLILLSQVKLSKVEALELIK